MKKITEWGLEILLAPSLEGTFFYENIFLELDFRIDGQNFVIDKDIDTLKKLLMTVLRFKAKYNHVYSHKLKLALRGLLLYGTEAVSTEIEKSLDSVAIIPAGDSGSEMEIDEETKKIIDRLIADQNDAI